MAVEYDLGDRVRLSAAFTQSGSPKDPSEVRLRYRSPASTATSTELWNSGLGNVVRDSTGNFHFDLVLSSSGVWTYRWSSTGTVEASTPDLQIFVRGSTLF